MSIQQMQEKIIERVGEVNDENVLQMLDEALALYNEGKIKEAKEMYQEIKSQARPRPIEFEF